MLCYFATDLHGRRDRYEKLWSAIEDDPPDAVFLGGDLLPSGLLGVVGAKSGSGDFIDGFLADGFDRLRTILHRRYPAVFLILGNDDGRSDEGAIRDLAATGLWNYSHNCRHELGPYSLLGYSYVPPTPFWRKDWERYDVSRYIPVGCVSPEEGNRSVSVRPLETRYATIQHDLTALSGAVDLDSSVFLFHAPPSETNLDRVANDGKFVDYVPLDLHVGSIAIRRFIEERQPLLTLHGHIHESARLTGSWKDRIGRTHLFGAAHDGPELALIRFHLDDLARATRDLL